MKRVLIKPLVTEKSSEMMGKQKFTFLVDSEANKIGIRQEVESQFGVKVKDVKTISLKGKKRRRGRIVGKTDDKKKAIVTLADGQDVESMKGLY